MSFGLKTAAVKVAGTSASLPLLEAEDGGAADDVGNFQFVFSASHRHHVIPPANCSLLFPVSPSSCFLPLSVQQPPCPPTITHHLLYSLYVNRHAYVH